MSLKNYEAMVIFDQNYSSSDLETEVKKVEDYLQEHVQNLKKNKMGRRELAYIIKGKKYGFYMVYTFDAAGQFVKYELEKKLNLNESVLRHIIRSNDSRKMLKLPYGGQQVDVDYKNTDLLNQFVSEYNRILPRKVTNLKQREQKKIGAEVKIARIMGLLPFTSECLEK